MGYLSFANSVFTPKSFVLKSIKGLWVLGAICAATLLVAPAQSQSNPFGARAGSRFSGHPNQYGEVRRPYRRRQKPAKPQPPAEQVDYRLNASEDPEQALFGSYDDSFDSEIESASYDGCACGSGVSCTCGTSVDASCGCDDGCTSGGCPLGFGGGHSRRGIRQWRAGFEASFVKARFSENVAFTTTDDDGANNITIFDTEFDNDLEFNPRVWLGADINDNWSWQTTYWEFDHGPDTITTSPNVNGFGLISHPDFAPVDISTTIPTDVFNASSTLEVYTIDIEALKRAQLGRWNLGVGGGVRYANVQQSYFAQLTNAAGGVRGDIDFSQEIEGFGPTISLAASRPLLRRINLVCAARGSLLFGNGDSVLLAREDVDLTPADLITTNRFRSRDDLLPVSEVRVGLEWLSPRVRGRGYQWLLNTAMEGQFWGNAGNATSETADLGFFGFTFGAGILR